MTEPTSLFNKGEERPTTSWPMSSQYYQRRRPLSNAKSLAGLATVDAPRRRGSNTWSSSSGDPLLLSEGDRVDNRHAYITKYNQLAHSYGIRQIVPGDFLTNENTSQPGQPRKTSWVHRAIRRTPSGRSTKTVNANVDEEQRLRRRRSISDVALNLVHHTSRDVKNLDLQALVRLCGKSLFFLPQGYASGSLVLPTCLRAVAQYLVQHVDEQGLFRVPGSIRVVNMLYDYYCADKDVDNISTTTRCPDLPFHIRCGPHDVASAFKKFLSGLPGGILGSLSTFDALVTVHSQLHFDPECNQTRKTKLRARMIALAILTVPSQYQRDLICAVFGLLCLIGRTADTAPREDESGRPLPTANLMGYNALGVLFGPLLVNELIDSYSLRQADPAAGLVLLPVSPPRSRKERHRHRHRRKESSTQPEDHSIRNTHIANEIAEMIIVHWRDVVLQMRNVSKSIRRHKSDARHGTDRAIGFKVGSSASHTNSLREPSSPLGWDEPEASHQRRNTYPETTTPTPSPKLTFSTKSHKHHLEPLSIKRHRSRPSSSGTSHKIPARPSASCLSPTVEESPSTSNIMTGVTNPRPEIKFRHSFENIRDPRASPATNANEGQHKPRKGKAVGYARSHGDLVHPPDRLEIYSSSSSDREFHMSEKTLRKVRSSVSGVGNREGYVRQTGGRPSRFEELISPADFLSKKPTTSVGSLISTQAQDAGPATRWEAFAQASQVSSSSLSGSINERRLHRCPAIQQIPGSPRTLEERRQRRAKLQQHQSAKPFTKKWGSSEESLLARACRAMTPAHRSKARTSAESASDKERTSAAQRSTSKPISGAVKAMAALFKRPSPPGSTYDVLRRARNFQASHPETTSASHFGSPGTHEVPGRLSKSRESLTNMFRVRRSRTASASKSDVPGTFEVIGRPTREFWGASSGMQPEKSSLNRKLASSVNHSNASPASSSPATPRDTPVRRPPVSLRSSNYVFPLGMTPLASTPSTEQIPQRDRDRDRDQPPSLGTMVPHAEEPPVAQHISFPRPPRQGTPSVNEHEHEHDGTSEATPQRTGSSNNSILHARIRYLQRQLDARTEESAHLRRQLEARDDMDTGKLCEQLRGAQREATMWRARAEAAERRVAVFERLTARIRGLRDAVVEEEGNGAGNGNVTTTGIALPGMVPAVGDGQFDGLSSPKVAGAWSSEETKGSEDTVSSAEIRCRAQQRRKWRSSAVDSAAGPSSRAAEKGKGKGNGDGGAPILKAENNYGLWTKPAKKPVPTDTGSSLWKKAAEKPVSDEERTAKLWAIAEDFLAHDRNGDEDETGA